MSAVLRLCTTRRRDGSLDWFHHGGVPDVVPRIRPFRRVIRPRLRAGQPCPYCGVTMRTHDDSGEPLDPNHGAWPTREHVLPLSRGGTDHPSNVIVTCRACNWLRDNLTLVEWLDLLRADDDPQAARIAVVIAILARRGWRVARDAATVAPGLG